VSGSKQQERGLADWSVFVEPETTAPEFDAVEVLGAEAKG
jgi:hypothetical protein